MCSGEEDSLNFKLQEQWAFLSFLMFELVLQPSHVPVWRVKSPLDSEHGGRLWTAAAVLPSSASAYFSWRRPSRGRDLLLKW